MENLLEDLDLTVDDFDIPRRRRQVMNNEYYETTYDLIEILSKYKIIEDEKLILTLNAYTTGDNRVTENEIKFIHVDRIDFSLDPEIIKLMDKYKVFIEIPSDHMAHIYVNPWMVENLKLLEIELARYTIEYHYLTPGCMNEALGIKPSEYNAYLLYKRIIADAIEKNATDVHIGVRHPKGLEEYYLAYRMGIDLIEQDIFKFDKVLNKEMLFTIVKEHTDTDPNDILTGGIQTAVYDLFGDSDVDVRLGVTEVLGGYKYVSRIQKSSTVSLKIKELGFDKSTQRTLNSLSRKLSGATFITGAIRTGKNTTAFAMANEMIEKNISIMEYSSPIETLMAFDQSNYQDSEERLLQSIKYAKKQDLNVAFINEIPDNNVAFAIRDLVNSSVHVITTFHLDRLWNLPNRLYDFYGNNFKDMLIRVNGVVNQKMYVKLCPYCRKEMLTTDLEDDMLIEFLLKRGVTTVSVSDGCSQCFEGKMKDGLQPVAECVQFTSEMKSELLKLDKPYEMELYLKDYMFKNKIALEDKLVKYVSEGIFPYTVLETII